MPRIAARTVVEHRRRQYQSVVTAARRLIMVHGPDSLTMGVVADRAGLARNSVYEYFPSRDALLAQICEDELTPFVTTVCESMSHARTPQGVVRAYVTTQLELVGTRGHRLGLGLSRRPFPADVRRRIAKLHAELEDPLAEALRALGRREPQRLVVLVQGVCDAGATAIERGDDVGAVTRAAVALVLSGLDGR